MRIVDSKWLASDGQFRTKPVLLSRTPMPPRLVKHDGGRHGAKLALHIFEGADEVKHRAFTSEKTQRLEYCQQRGVTFLVR
jgi:hypothetical protein